MAETEGNQAVEDVTVDTQDAAGVEPSARMNLTVNIEDVGPCKKHVRIVVPRADIDTIYETLVDDYSGKAEVPGFRVGHVPLDLIRKRFKTELGEQVKQRVLMASLEQLGEDSDLDPINEPNLDLESIVLPDDGDFEYEFDVEVRPEFELPNYRSLKISRPTREIQDKDVDAYIEQFVGQYGKLVPIDAAAQPGDFVNVDIRTTYQGKELSEIKDVSVRVRKTLRFRDAEIPDFESLMKGAKAGDVREVEIPVSMEAETIEMRGEPVHLVIKVLDVKRLEKPDIDAEFLERIGADSEEDFRRQIRNMLDRQTQYEQRQSCRRQVLEQITESATWELPEDLVAKQVDNALRREILEMQQAGFTTKEIVARENDLRQRSLSMTRQNLKEHFVLDRIAEAEEISVTADDLNAEIALMAIQSGENPRRVRARLIKSGMIENLEAQVRERKAVDVILKNAEFKDVPLPPAVETEVEGLNRSICRASAVGADTEVEVEAEEEA